MVAPGLIRAGGIAALSAGAGGPPALLLHGLPFHAGLWRPVMARLPADRRWVAPDLPGYGGSAPLSGRWSIAAHLEWLERVRRALALPGWPSVHLVGHEYGGLLAAALCAERGAASLTLLSTSLGPGWLAARAAAWPGLHRLFYRRWGGTRYRDHAVAPADRAALAAAFPLPGTRDFAEQMRATGRQLSVRVLLTLERRLRARLSAAAIPSRLIWGEADRTFPAAGGRRLARRLGASWRALPGARHLAPWTHPAAAALAMSR